MPHLRAGAGLRRAAARALPARPDGPALALAALAVLGAAHILVRTSAYGPVPGSDSVNYLSAAVNLLGGEGLVNYRGHDFLLWPPGYPLLLAAAGFAGADPLEAARWIGAASFGLAILVSGLWLRRRVRSRAAATAAAASVAVSVPLSTAATHAATEAPFALLALLALLALERALPRGRGERRRLAAAAALAGLAAAVRWPGAALIATGVLLLLAHGAGPPRARLPRAAARAAAFAAAASLLPALAAARNLAAAGTLAGERSGEASPAALAGALGQIASAFGAWAAPAAAPDWSAWPLRAAAALVLLACLASALLPLAAPGIARARRGASPDLGRGLGPVVPFLAFAAVYLATLAATAPWNYNVPIGSRFLTPLYAPLALAAAFLIGCLLAAGGASGPARAARGLAWAALAAAALHAAGSAAANLDLTARTLASGWPGWELHERLRDSETIAWARANGYAAGPTWSSDRRLLWLADRSAAPGRHRALPDGRGGLVRWLADGEGEAIAVWLEGEPYWRRFGYASLDLRALPGAETVAELADGAVFRLRRGAPPGEAAWERARAAEAARLGERVRAGLGEPRARGPFEVYADAAARTLTYVRVPCVPADVEARFFLHVVPRDAGDLPSSRRASGFANLDFAFAERGTPEGGACVAEAALPEWEIASVRTGQFGAGGELWSAEFAP